MKSIFILLIFWKGSPDVTTLGQYASYQQCQKVADRVLEHGTGWDGFTCFELQTHRSLGNLLNEEKQ